MLQTSSGCEAMWGTTCRDAKVQCCTRCARLAAQVSTTSETGSDMIQTTSVRYWPRWWNPGSSDRWLPTYMNLRRHRPSPMPAMLQRLQQQRHRADKPSSTRSPRPAQSAHATSRRRQAKACRQCTAFCASSWMKVHHRNRQKAEPSAHLHTQTDHRLTASRARG